MEKLTYFDFLETFRFFFFVISSLKNSSFLNSSSNVTISTPCKLFLKVSKVLIPSFGKAEILPIITRHLGLYDSNHSSFVLNFTNSCIRF